MAAAGATVMGPVELIVGRASKDRGVAASCTLKVHFIGGKAAPSAKNVFQLLIGQFDALRFGKHKHLFLVLSRFDLGDLLFG